MRTIHPLHNLRLGLLGTEKSALGNERKGYNMTFFEAAANLVPLKVGGAPSHLQGKSPGNEVELQRFYFFGV